MAAKETGTAELQGLEDGASSSTSMLQQSNLGAVLHTDDKLRKSNPDDAQDSGGRHDFMMEKPSEYLMKLTRDYVDNVQAMPSPKFNIEQCKYLSEKLKTTLEKARVLLEGYQAQPSSIMDMNRWRESFKLLMVFGKQVECFFQECVKDAWIQPAMTLADGGEYVSSIGFNLELCKVALFEKEDETKTLTMEEVGNLHANEVKIVKKKALVDAKTLLNKAIEIQQSSNAQDWELAKYLMFKVNGNTANSSFVEDNSNILTKLFQVVKNVGGRVEQIGRGSSARVYKVVWFGTPAAKKTFYGPSVVEFLQEVKILSQLHHPNITSMFCFSMNKKECSIVMELMDGSLHDLLRSRKNEEDEFLPFTDLEGLNLMIQVGEGVEYLHRKKIVHRDLKSANILVKRVEVFETMDEFVLLKVVDFGLSKTKESSVSYSSITYNVGSNRWMAPEIIKFKKKNEEVDERLTNFLPKYNFKGDIYSLGMVFMEILTGEVPFQSIGSEKVVKQMVLEGKRPLLPKYCIPRLRELIVKCWSQEPNKRPSIGDICLELKYLKYILLTSGFSQGCSSLRRMLEAMLEKEKEESGIEDESRLEILEILETVIPGSSRTRITVARLINMAKSPSAECRAKVASTLLRFVQAKEPEMQDEGAFDALTALLEDENADTRADAVLALDLLSQITTIQTEMLSFSRISPFLRSDCREELKAAAARLLALVIRNARSAKVFMEAPDAMKIVLHLLEKDPINPSSRECACGLLELATEEDGSVRLELASAGLGTLIKFVTFHGTEDDKALLTTVLYLLCTNGKEEDVIKAEGHVFLLSSLGDNKSNERAVRGLWILFLCNPASERVVLGAGFVGAAIRCINSNFTRSEMALGLAQTSLSPEALNEMASALAKVSSSSSERLLEIVECEDSEGALLSLLEHCSSLEGKAAAAAVIAKLYPKLAKLEDRSRHEKLSLASSRLFKCLKETDKSQLKEFLKALAVVAAGEKGMNNILQIRGVLYLIDYFESESSDTEVRRLVLQIFAEMSSVFNSKTMTSSVFNLKGAFKTNDIGNRLCSLPLTEDNSESLINLLKIIRNYSQAGEGADAAVSVLLEVLEKHSLRGNVLEVIELALEALAKFIEDADRRRTFITSHGIKTVADVMKLSPLADSVLCYCIVILAKVIEESRSKRDTCRAIFNCKLLTPLKDAMFQSQDPKVKWQSVVLVHLVVLHGPSSVYTAIHNEGMLHAVIDLLRTVPGCKEVTTQLLKRLRGNKICKNFIDRELLRLRLTL